MKAPIRKAVVPALIAFAFTAGSAWAQTAPVSAMSSSTAASSSTTTSHAQRRMDIVEQQITTLHSQLNITDAQSKQWDAYAQTMRDNAQQTSQAFTDRKAKMATMNADDTMKSYAELTQMHADQMKKLSSAWSDVYAVLSSEQKETADKLFRNPKLVGASSGHRPPARKHPSTSKPASSSSAAASGT